MRILDRYLIREYLAPLITCVLAFCLLFIIFDLFDKMGRFLNADAPPLSVLVYYLHYLFAFNGNMSMIVAILPVSLLLAALYCSSNMIRNNEFVAMMAGGISFNRILAPFIGIGVLASLVALLAQERQAPQSMRWMRRYEKTVLKREAPAPFVKDFLFLNSSAQRLWHIPKFASTNTFSLGEVVVTHLKPDRSETIYTTGSAYWADGTWWLRNPRIEQRNPDGAIVGEPEVYPRQVIEMRSWTEKPHDFIIELEAQQDWEGLSAADLRRYLDNHPDFPKAKRALLATHYQARYATPFTCLVVALLGVPAGLLTGRSNVMGRIFLSLGLFFLFYFALQISLGLGKMQILPAPLAAWIPNIVFTGIGLRLVQRLQ